MHCFFQLTYAVGLMFVRQSAVTSTVNGTENETE
jgi:hypothetical protein